MQGGQEHFNRAVAVRLVVESCFRGESVRDRAAEGVVSLFVGESDQAVDVAVSGHTFDYGVGICLDGL